MRSDEKIRIFTRMGRELAALHDLLCDIICDREYQSVTTQLDFGKMNKMFATLDSVRSDCESRMFRMTQESSSDIFYPHERDDLRSAISEFRNSMSKEEMEN